MFLSSAILTTLALAFECSGAHIAAHVGRKTVDLGYAVYETNISTDVGVTSFLGVRYAAPPTGDLRFRAPRAPAKMSGIQHATAQAVECWQSAGGSISPSPKNFTSLDTGAQSEDCLFLNVHVPTQLDLQSHAPLRPVIAWLHGGGYGLGSNSLASISSPQTFVRNSNYSVISVQMQYRLGPFGFLAGEAVGKDGALNAGLLDQQFALQWIQKHIYKFGGDPSRVTIYGESAGAGSVLQHLIANGGNTQPPLFRAAMTDSIYLPFQYEYNDPIVESIYADLSGMSGCSASSSSLSCLRSVDASALNEMGQIIARKALYGTFTFVPVVDGSFIAERPTVALRKQRTNAGTLLSLTNAHEGSIFVDAAALTEANSTLAEYVTSLFPRMNESSVLAAAALYANMFDVDAATVPEQAAYVIGESIIACPAFYALEAFPNSGWKGEFAVPPAFHSGEMAYVWADSVFGFPEYNNSAFISSFQQSFFSTAISLDPNAHSLADLKPYWPSWKESAQVMVFNKTATGEPVVIVNPEDEALRARCAFWHSLAAVNSQ